MATATKQLEAIFQEITENFSHDDRITITPIDGDPPEQYEVTYRIKGAYKDDSGEIQVKDDHVVNISIPFGFPHFPPSCKPKSTIFHPDFDPAAICIGDFWEKDRSISDLILHIAQMISGQIFSTSNTFNEEALKWYKDHRDQLPFEDLDRYEDSDMGGEIDFTPPPEDDVTSLLEETEDDAGFDDLTIERDRSEDDYGYEHEQELPEEDETSGIDTLDESFLETDFDYLSQDKSEPETDELLPPESENETDQKGGIDAERLKILAKQKRFFELDTELGSITARSFPEQDQLAQRAKEALQQAREIYNQGTEFEHQGNPGRALDAFRQAEAVVADYPGLQEDIERTAQAKELLGDWIEPESQETYESTPIEEDFEEPVSHEEPEPPEEKGGTRTLFEETARYTSKLIPYAFGAVLAITLGISAIYYFINSAELERGQKKFTECQAVLKQNRFAEAERQCESALDIVKQIRFFKSGARDDLVDEIEHVLSSQVLQEGLAGNLLYEGKFVPKHIVKAIQSFKYFMNKGDEFFNGQDWQKASSNYKEALEFSKKEKGIDPELVFAVSEKLKLAEFKALYQSGSEFIKREKWVLATQDLEKALAQVKDLTIDNKVETIDAITAKLNEISLFTQKERGDVSFAAGRWEEAWEYYKEALDTARKSHQTADSTINELRELVIRAELYATINKGKEAFNQSRWDEAIKNYDTAISILDNNRDYLKKASTEANKRKLARVMLQASVIKNKQDAAKNLKAQHYDNAIAQLKSIITTISNSDFSDEKEFAAVVKETQQAIDQAKTDALLADKIVYLEDHFKELFTKHYTASPPESLVDPKVTFEKRMGNKLIFKLQCVEVGQGRPLKLVMMYMHDLDTGKWNFYSGSN